ncbi:MAG TPA: DUF1778 domain-containing protein [Rhizomicrobium sp.]
MKAATTRKPRAQKAAAKSDTVVNLRMPSSVRDLIDNAAGATGKTRTAFIIESSSRLATDVLLDQRLFTLPGAQYDAFAKALEETPPPNARLKRLLSGKAPWET